MGEGAGHERSKEKKEPTEYDSPIGFILFCIYSNSHFFAFSASNTIAYILCEYDVCELDAVYLVYSYFEMQSEIHQANGEEKHI